MKNIRKILVPLMLFVSFTLQAQGKNDGGQKVFIKHVDQALSIVSQAAEEMSIKGVAMIAYIPGEVTESWISKMKVVGILTNERSNLLAIASSKAAEMADTFQDSGSGVREPLRGEFGYKGGAIEKVEGGYILAVFSGATGEQDLAVSKKGLKYLRSQYK